MYIHTHTLTHTLSLTHTHTLSLSLSLALALSLSLSLNHTVFMFKTQNYQLCNKRTEETLQEDEETGTPLKADSPM